MVIPPKYAVSKVADTSKKNISGSLNIKFTGKAFVGENYLVSTAGANKEVIRK